MKFRTIASAVIGASTVAIILSVENAQADDPPKIVWHINVDSDGLTINPVANGAERGGDPNSYTNSQSPVPVDKLAPAQIRETVSLMNFVSRNDLFLNKETGRNDFLELIQLFREKDPAFAKTFEEEISRITVVVTDEYIAVDGLQREPDVVMIDPSTGKNLKVYGCVREGDRIFVNIELFKKKSPETRNLEFTHEVTHSFIPPNVALRPRKVETVAHQLNKMSRGAWSPTTAELRQTLKENDFDQTKVVWGNRVLNQWKSVIEELKRTRSGQSILNFLLSKTPEEARKLGIDDRDLVIYYAIRNGEVSTRQDILLAARNNDNSAQTLSYVLAAYPAPAELKNMLFDIDYFHQASLLKFAYDYAHETGNCEKLAVALKFGANPNLRYSENEDLLLSSLTKSIPTTATTAVPAKDPWELEAIKLFLEAGADPNPAGALDNLTSKVLYGSSTGDYGDQILKAEELLLSYGANIVFFRDLSVSSLNTIREHQTGGRHSKESDWIFNEYIARLKNFAHPELIKDRIRLNSFPMRFEDLKMLHKEMNRIATEGTANFANPIFKFIEIHKGPGQSGYRLRFFKEWIPAGQSQGLVKEVLCKDVKQTIEVIELAALEGRLVDKLKKSPRYLSHQAEIKTYLIQNWFFGENIAEFLK